MVTNNPVDTGRKLNVLCTFNLRPASTGKSKGWLILPSPSSLFLSKNNVCGSIFKHIENRFFVNCFFVLKNFYIVFCFGFGMCALFK